MSELIPEHPQGSAHVGNVADEVAAGQQYLHVAVVSPSRQIFAGDAHWVSLTGVDGQFGVWPRHAALVSALASGSLRIGLPGHTHLEYASHAGFASVADNVLTVLVDQALTREEIDVEAAQRELAEVDAAIAEETSSRALTRLADKRAWCQARLKLTEK